MSCYRCPHRPSFETISLMRSWSSDKVGSDYSDSHSSIETREDSSGRREHHSGRHSTGFTDREERQIRRSLGRKLLSDDGVRLSRIERRLLRADHSKEGSVGISSFRATLAAASKSDRVDIQRDEILWLIQKLSGRNGRKVNFLKIRALLENEENEGTTGGGHRSRSESRRQVERERHRQYKTRRTSMSRRGEGRHRRDRMSEDDGGGRVGHRGQTTSESDSSSRGGAILQWRSSPPHPARWATRRGTVGQWLHEVAAPMVSSGKPCMSGHQSGTTCLLDRPKKFAYWYRLHSPQLFSK